MNKLIIKQDNKEKKKYSNKYFMFALVFILLLIIVIDYFNIPSILNIKINNFNMDFLNIIINSTIVISLYIFTYKMIDKKNLNKSKNKSDICKRLMLLTYLDCIEKADFFSEPKTLSHIFKKVDFNSTEDRITSNLQKTPFEHKEIIIELFKEGEVDVNSFEVFFEIEKLYKNYISFLITFFDHSEMYLPLKKELQNKVRNEIKKLELN